MKLVEKLVPHYDLGLIKTRVDDIGVRAFTRTAIDGARKLGLTADEALTVVASLQRVHFYKSMTTHVDHRVWQDVYHGPTGSGRMAYIKLTLRDGAIVIQFKEL